MDIERLVSLAVVVLASFALGFFLGNAHATSKYVRKQRKYIKDTAKKHLKQIEEKENEDTETGELEMKKATQGHPDNT